MCWHFPAALFNELSNFLFVASIPARCWSLWFIYGNCMGQGSLSKWAIFVEWWASWLGYSLIGLILVELFWLGYFPFLLTHIFGLKKWAWVPRLPSNLEPPFLVPSMGLMTTYYLPYHNPLKQAPGILRGLGPLKLVAWRVVYLLGVVCVQAHMAFACPNWVSSG